MLLAGKDRAMFFNHSLGSFCGGYSWGGFLRGLNISHVGTAGHRVAHKLSNEMEGFNVQCNSIFSVQTPSIKGVKHRSPAQGSFYNDAY